VHTVGVAFDPARSVLGLTVLLPNLTLDRLTGGPNTALNLGARISAAGLPVRFVATHGDADDPATLRTHVATLVGPDVALNGLSFESLAGGQSLQLGPRDVLLATWWPTAHIAMRALAETTCREFLYLIQDYEPGFYAHSTNHALATATYGFPVRAIFNEGLVRDHFRSAGIGRFGTDTDSGRSIAFEPAVDRVLFAAARRSGPRTLLFYARPRNPRNAFELGLRAVRVAAQAGAFPGDWDFAFIGDQVPDLALGDGRTIRRLPWQSLADYGALLGRSDVLLSLMLSPHTSYPPLEMAMAGGHVVTNTFGAKTAEALAGLSSRIIAVAPEVDALAAALAAAAARPRPDEGSGDLRLPATWSEALAPTVDWSLEAIAAIAAGR